MSLLLVCEKTALTNVKRWYSTSTVCCNTPTRLFWETLEQIWLDLCGILEMKRISLGSVGLRGHCWNGWQRMRLLVVRYKSLPPETRLYIPPFSTIYGLVQCTPDLSEAQCSSCLDKSINTFASEVYTGSSGGRSLLPACNFRYETYKFFNMSTMVMPSPSPPIWVQPPPGNICILIIVMSRIRANISMN